MYDLYTDLQYGQYIWNGVLEDLQKYISKIPDGETLDIRRCRFDPRCISVIMLNIPRLNIINSEEPELNYILQHNRKVKTTPPGSVVRKNIEAVFYDEDGKRIDDFLRRLKNEDKDVVWQIPNEVGSEYITNYMLVMLGLLMHFPQRKFDIHNFSPATFSNLARRYFEYDDFIDSDYIYLTLGNGRFMRFEITDLEKYELHIHGIGVLTLDNMISKYNALPGWLGVERVIGTPRSKILEKVYSDVKFADRIRIESDDKSIRGYIAKYGGCYE